MEYNKYTGGTHNLVEILVLIYRSLLELCRIIKRKLEIQILNDHLKAHPEMLIMYIKKRNFLRL
jgi:hypothetical protein